LRRFAPLFAPFAVLVFAASALAAASQRVEVRVLAPGATPLAGAAVTVDAVDGEPFSAAATSDDGGRAVFELPSARRAYRLSVEHAEHAPFAETVDLAARRLARGETLRMEVELLPLTAVDLFNRGVRALQAGDRAAAETEFRRAVEKDPDFARGWGVLALVALDGRRYEDALAASDRALALAPDDVDALRSRHDALAALGRHDEADVALTALAAKDASPELARLLFNAGAVAANGGQVERARARFTEALARDPQLWQAHNALAELAVREQDLERALAELERAIELSPRQSRTWERKIEVLKALGRADEAAAAEQQLAALRAEG
jgi:tetratricopeptide (TPR) repeat protein